MGKRHYRKKETEVTKALKRMRESKSRSLKWLERETGISASEIGHKENGRVDEISEKYINTITLALGYKADDWYDFFNGGETQFDLKEDCMKLISELDKNKLKSLKTMLEGFL